MATQSNILALDIGERRIGMALASGVARLASPLGIITTDADVYAALRSVIEREQIGTIVVGRPLNMSGQETAQTAAVRQVASGIHAHFGIPVIEQDETLTSRRAEEELRARGTPFTKGDIDALAATYILEDYLAQEDSHE